MEGNKQKGTSSSFTSELFGSKESHPSSSSGIFGSIFSPPSSKVLGRESLRAELSGKIANESWSSKIGIQDHFSKGNGSKAHSAVNKDMSSIYQDQRAPPCNLSCSIRYGGQEIYSNPQSTQNEGLNSLVTGSNSGNGLSTCKLQSTGLMEEKMIQELLQEETGGKDLSIIKITLAKACASQGMYDLLKPIVKWHF
ncbi:Proteasome inhibitor-related protein [Spatholobus suberectus]|nr:Proteasome inhibitor-related protein [Spatholobus suberectus]